MKNNYHKALRHPFHWITGCMVLLAACQGAPEQEQQQQQQEEKQPEGLRTMATGAPPPQYLTRHVMKCELDMMRTDFASFFTSGPSSSSLASISPAQVDISWRVLDSLVRVVKPGGDGYQRGLWITYGIKAGNPPSTPDQFTVGFSVAQLTDPNSDSTQWLITDVPGHFFVKNAQGQWTDIGSKDNWSDDEAYAARAHVRRASDVSVAEAESVQSGFDTRAYLMQWEGELVKLMGDNGTPPTIRFSAVGMHEQLIGDLQYDMHQRIVAVAVAGNGSEIIANDPIVTATPFKNRAAEMGNPCPPFCPGKLAQFRSQGPVIRTPCP